jgi:rubrerythrin
MSDWYINNSDIGYQDSEWNTPNPHKGEWVIDTETLRKWECGECGLSLWVDTGDKGGCPTCTDDTTNPFKDDGSWDD